MNANYKTLSLEEKEEVIRGSSSVNVDDNLVITDTLNGGNAAIESTTAIIPGAVTPTLTNANRLGLQTEVQVPPILNYPNPVILPESNSNNQEQTYCNVFEGNSNIEEQPCNNFLESNNNIQEQPYCKVSESNSNIQEQPCNKVSESNSNIQVQSYNDILESQTISPVSQQSFDAYDYEFEEVDLATIFNELAMQAPTLVNALFGSMPQFPDEDSVAAPIALSAITHEPVVSPPSVESTSLRPKVEYSMDTLPSTSTGTSSSLRPIGNDRQLRNVGQCEPSVSSSTTTKSTRPARKKRRSDNSISESLFEDGNDVDDLYRETSKKNNEASRKPRMNKKAKQRKMAQEEVELERKNRSHRPKVEHSMDTLPSTSTGTSSSLRPISNDRQLRNVGQCEPSVSSSTTTNSTRPARNKRRSDNSISESLVEDGNDVNDLYRETRKKNNEASRKSRMIKKAKERELAQEQVELELRNRSLREIVDNLQAQVDKFHTIFMYVAKTDPRNQRKQ